jgi:hypothetical protein
MIGNGLSDFVKPSDTSFIKLTLRYFYFGICKRRLPKVYKIHPIVNCRYLFVFPKTINVRSSISPNASIPKWFKDFKLEMDLITEAFFIK